MHKWFLYTTYNKVFQNGSLTNVRKVFRRFEEYLDGKASAAIDYTPLVPFDFGFKFSLRNASSDFLAIVLIHNYRKYVDEETILEYSGFYAPFDQKSPENQFILLNKSDKSKLLSCFNKRGGTMSDDEMRRFALYSEMIHDICDDDEWNFGYRRRFLLDKLIWNLLQEYGLEEDIPVG